MSQELHANNQTHISISAKDLPLQCPMPDMLKWNAHATQQHGDFTELNAHPRVFLKIEKEPNHEITCPYCSTHYKLDK